MAEKNTSSNKSTTSIRFNSKFLVILLLIVFGGGLMSAISFTNDNKDSFLKDNYIVVSNGYIDNDNRYPSVSFLNVDNNSYLYYQPIKVSGIDTSVIYDSTTYVEVVLLNNNSATLHTFRIYDFYKTNVLKIPDTINEPIRVYFYFPPNTRDIKLFLNMAIVDNENQRLIFNENKSNQLKFDFTNVNDMNNLGSLILNENNVKSIFGVVDFIGNIRDGFDSIFKFVNATRETSFKFITDGFAKDLGRWFRSIDFRFNPWVGWFN